MGSISVTYTTDPIAFRAAEQPFPTYGHQYLHLHTQTEANTELLQVMDTTLKRHIDNRNYPLLESGDVPLRIHIRPPAFPQT